jgi:hypothetical protein
VTGDVLQWRLQSLPLQQVSLLACMATAILLLCFMAIFLQVPPIFPRVCLTSPREVYQDVQWGIKICTYQCFPLQSVPVFITYRKCFAKLFGEWNSILPRYCDKTLPSPQGFLDPSVCIAQVWYCVNAKLLSNLCRSNGIRCPIWEHKSTIDVSASS